MREQVRDKNRLEHIIEAIDTIQARADNITYDQLVADKLLFGGVVYYTMVIGEAAYKLSRSFVAHYPDVEWDVIANMRHHLVHGYYQVNVLDVWDVCSMTLPRSANRWPICSPPLTGQNGNRPAQAGGKRTCCHGMA